MNAAVEPMTSAKAGSDHPLAAFGLDTVARGAARLRADPGWNVHDMPCGHDAMIDMPDRLTELLVAAA